MSRPKRYALIVAATFVLIAFVFLWLASHGEGGGGSYQLIFDSEGHVIDAKPR